MRPEGLQVGAENRKREMRRGRVLKWFGKKLFTKFNIKLRLCLNGIDEVALLWNKTSSNKEDKKDEWLQVRK